MNSRFPAVTIIFMICAAAASALARDSMTRTGAAGSRFVERGKITLHRGEPCTSQIMFDFHPLDARSTVWMAAGAHDSTKLTEAARTRNRVQISGIWKRGRQTDCGYVEVKKVIVERSWWGSLFKP